MGIQYLAKPEVPVINFSIENVEPESTKWLETCSHVRAALEEYGCFLAEYGGSQEKDHDDDAIFKSFEELYDLPLETKVKNVSDKPYHGFLDHRVPFVPPLFESFGIENSTSFEALQSFVNLMWSSGNSHFCENVFSYTKKLSEMEKLVKRMMFESYGVEKYYDSHIASTTYLLRTMKYRIPEMGEEKIGAEAHTDKTFFTILHQKYGANGLEIKTKNGHHWLPVQFSSNSFLFMAGDACLLIDGMHIRGTMTFLDCHGKLEFARNSISLAKLDDETTSSSNLIAPELVHCLESRGEEQKKGVSIAGLTRLFVAPTGRFREAFDPGASSLAWSNGRIHSATHRVIIEGSKERYSSGIFSYHKGIIEIPHELVDEQHPLRFNPFNHYGLLGYFSTDECDKVPSTAKAYCGLPHTL